MRHQIVFPAFVLAIAVSSSLQAGTVDAQLTVGSSRTLPGLSVPLHAHITSGDAALSVSRLVRIRVTPTHDPTFIAEWRRGIDHGLFDGMDDEQISIPAHSSADLFVTARHFAVDSWALDPRFAAVGRYQLELIIYQADDTRTPLVVSSSAFIDIASPTGADRDIWETFMSGKLDQRFGEEVFATSPKSPYVPYVIAFIARETRADQLAVLQKVVSLHPNSPMTPVLLAWMAYVYDIESRDAFTVQHDLEKAVALADTERQILESLARGNDGWARVEARRRLENGIPTRAGYLELERLLRK